MKKTLLICTILALASQATAAILISNYPPANDDASSTVTSITGLFSKGGGFTLPGGSNYTLDSVTLRLEVNQVSAVLILGLYGSDVGGNPTGPQLVGFTIPVLAAGVGDVTFVPSTAFTLQQSSTYWLVASGSSPAASPAGINWLASFPGIVPTGIATSAGYRFSTNAVLPTGSSTLQNTYRVNATAQSAVPEPATVTLWSLAGCAGLFLARRRAKTTA